MDKHLGLIRKLRIYNNAMDLPCMNLRQLTSLSVHQASNNFHEEAWFYWLKTIIDNNPMIDTFALHVQTGVSQASFKKYDLLNRMVSLQDILIANDSYNSDDFSLLYSVLNIKKPLRLLTYSMNPRHTPNPANIDIYIDRISNIRPTMHIEELRVTDPYGHHEASLVRRCSTLINFKSIFHRLRKHSHHHTLMTKAFYGHSFQLNKISLSGIYKDTSLDQDNTTPTSDVLNACSTIPGVSQLDISYSRLIRQDSIQNLAALHSTSLRCLDINFISYISPNDLPLVMSSFPNLTKLRITINCDLNWQSHVLDKPWACINLEKLHVDFGHRLKQPKPRFSDMELPTLSTNYSYFPISFTLQRLFWSSLRKLSKLRLLSVRTERTPENMLTFLQNDATHFSYMKELRKFAVSENLVTEQSVDVLIMLRESHTHLRVTYFKDPWL